MTATIKQISDSSRFRDLFRIRMTLDPHHVQRDERHLIKYGHFNILDQMAGDDSRVCRGRTGSCQHRSDQLGKRFGINFGHLVTLAGYGGRLSDQ